MTKTDSKQDAGSSAIGDAYTAVTERVTAAYSAAREQVSGAAHGAAGGVDANPLAALFGGLAIGAIAGVLVPRLAQERELLGPVGARLGEAMRAAMEAGRSAGLAALDDAGLNADNLRGQASRFVEQALGAVGQAGSAALDAARASAAK